MGTSVGAVNDAILKVLQAAGEVGLHIDDLVSSLGFNEKMQVLPRLYNLCGRKLIEKHVGQIWRVKCEIKADADMEVPDDPETPKTDTKPQTEQLIEVGKSTSFQGNSKVISYKNILQEYCQKQYFPVPTYTSQKNDFGFIGIVSFGCELIKASVAVPSLKESEQIVAFEALKIINVLPNDAKLNVPGPAHMPTRKRKSTQLGCPSISPPSKIKNTQQQDYLSWKNLLQETAQKHCLKMPEYHIDSNGNSFTATVEFQGRTFTSIGSFDKKKAAEQNAAHVALYSLGIVQSPPTSMRGDSASTTKHSGPLVQDAIMASSPLWTPNGHTQSLQQDHSNENFKNKLQECMQKKRANLPEYRTTYESVSGISGFVCKVLVEGQTFQGNMKQCKKDAEKDAARIAMISLGLTTF